MRGIKNQRIQQQINCCRAGRDAGKGLFGNGKPLFYTGNLLRQRAAGGSHAGMYFSFLNPEDFTERIHPDRQE